MNTVIDILKIAFNGLQKLSAKDFYLTILGALVFSTLIGLACHFFYKLWNKSYRTTLTHKIMTVFSSVLSFLFIICFVGFTFLEEVAMSKILIWKEELKADTEFQHQTFSNAFYKVKESGLEDFSKVTEPESVGTFFPTENEKSKLLASETHYLGALKNFKNKHNFLSLILNVESDNAVNDIMNDRKGKNTYNTGDAIEIAADNLKESLFIQAPKVVKISRIILVLLFILVQMIPFGFISYSAYKNLKIQS